MFLSLADKDNVDEQLRQQPAVSETRNNTSNGDYTMNDHERCLRYKKLVEMGKIKKNYTENSINMVIKTYEIEDADWYIVLEEIYNKEQPLRELRLELEPDNNEPIKSSFIELANAIRHHTTLITFGMIISCISRNNKLALLFEALKGNRSIKNLWVHSSHFDWETTSAFAQTLMNNPTLICLCAAIYANAWYDDNNKHSMSLSVESVTELARSFETSVLERLSFHIINNKGFEVLAQFLPKTLVHLDLIMNELDNDSIPIIRSYLQLNGSTLKDLVLEDTLAREYFAQQESTSLSTVNIVGRNSWQANFFSNAKSFIFCPSIMNDSDWTFVFNESIEDKRNRREMALTLVGKFDQDHLNYFGTLVGEQFRFKILTIKDYAVHASILLELIRKLKENTSITDLRLDFHIDLVVFNELIDLLAMKTYITRLDLAVCLNISNEKVIILLHALKANTVLQSLTLNHNQIGDIGFQDLLSSLPKSLLQLKLENNLISAKSLPYLLDFIKARPLLREISLTENGISSSSIEVNVPLVMEEIFKIADANHCICHLDIKGIINARVAESINGNVNLYDARLREDHILELHNELKKNPNRNWSLGLACNYRISSVGYRHLADILSSKIVIVELSVAHSNMNEEMRTNLLNRLYNNKTLKKFVIRGNKLNNQNMKCIGRFIQYNPVLKEIDLRSCEIDADGAIHLAEALPGSNLETLHLDENSVSDRGCASLLSSIPPTLTYLSLRNNKITESSMQTILTFLAINRTLTELCVKDNPVCKAHYINRINYAFC